MRKKRINCSFYEGCSKCEYATLVKKNYWGEKIFICKVITKKHKEISAFDCGSFRCNVMGSEYILCESCTGGYPIKRVKRHV